MLQAPRYLSPALGEWIHLFIQKRDAYIWQHSQGDSSIFLSCLNSPNFIRNLAGTLFTVSSMLNRRMQGIVLIELPPILATACTTFCLMYENLWQ